jgi:hypothetical protein
MQQLFQGVSIEGNPVVDQVGIMSFELQHFFPFLQSEHKYFEIKEFMHFQILF